MLLQIIWLYWMIYQAINCTFTALCTDSFIGSTIKYHTLQEKQDLLLFIKPQWCKIRCSCEAVTTSTQQSWSTNILHSISIYNCFHWETNFYSRLNLLQ